MMENTRKFALCLLNELHKKNYNTDIKVFFKKNFVNIYLFLKHILKNRVKRTTLAIKEQA